MKYTALTCKTLTKFETEFRTEQYTAEEIGKIEMAAYIANMNQSEHREWTESDIFADFLRILKIDHIKTEQKNKGEKTMKATFKPQTTEKGITAAHRKEKNFSEQYTATVFNGSSAYDAVMLRIYHTEARCYCCVWVSDNCAWGETGRESFGWRSGSACATGGGYHRASHAAGHAIENAGIALDEHIEGRGDGAIEKAVESIARAMWSGSGYFVHVSHAHA